MLFYPLVTEFCGLKRTECFLGDAQKGADCQRRPSESLLSFATPPEAPFTDLFALKLGPLGYRFLYYSGLQIFKPVSAPKLDEAARVRLQRFEVITGLAQKEQVVSATFGLNNQEQQSFLSELLVETVWQIERSRGKY